MSARSKTGARLSLLVVDSEVSQREIVRAALLADGDDVDVDTVDGSAPAWALERLAAKRYDCVIISCDMSGSDRSLIQAVRAADERVAILAIVELDDPGDDLVAAGASDFIVRTDMTRTRLARRLRFAIRVAQSEADEHKAREEAERAAHAREEILTIVSHDLRNPLNAIGIAVHELADPRADAGMRDRYVAAILRATARAERLIRDILDAGLAESGRLVVEERPIQVAALLGQAARDHEVMARHAGMVIEVHVDPDLTQVRADRERLLQVLANLIGNALNHARGSGTVTLAAESAAGGERVRVSVIDRGPGIPADALPYVFDRFYQAKRQPRRRSGVGLGLAIAKSIVEAHGGKLSVESEPGKRTAFWFTLARA